MDNNGAQSHVEQGKEAEYSERQKTEYKKFFKLRVLTESSKDKYDPIARQMLALTAKMLLRDYEWNGDIARSLELEIKDAQILTGDLSRNDDWATIRFVPNNLRDDDLYQELMKSGRWGVNRQPPIAQAFSGLNGLMDEAILVKAVKVNTDKEWGDRDKLTITFGRKPKPLEWAKLGSELTPDEITTISENEIELWWD